LSYTKNLRLVNFNLSADNLKYNQRKKSVPNWKGARAGKKINPNLRHFHKRQSAN